MKLSKYVKLVKGGGYCMVAHVEDSGIWLGTRSAIFRATELPDMVGERTGAHGSGYAGKGMGESSF